MEDTRLTKNFAQKNSFISANKRCATKSWFFEVEPYSRMNRESLQELRDNLRLKKAMKRAIGHDAAPASLIEAIRRGIRA